MKASWICVTYGRPHLLNELLYCFLNQSWDNKELIIINDFKNATYKYFTKNVKIFNLKNRFKSLGEKRNYGLSKVEGDFIFFTDDDDIYFKDHTKNLIEFHSKNLMYDTTSNELAYYSIHNTVQEKFVSGVGFSGRCIKKGYSIKNKFNNQYTVGEDQDFLKNAKNGIIEEKNTTYHYRWGLNINHVSGHSLDCNVISEQTNVWEKIEKDIIIKYPNHKTYNLHPSISCDVKHC